MEFVVIVEPDEVGRKRLESVFQTEKPSFSYKITESPEVAIGLLEQQHVDVLVCETHLSVISGREFFSMAKMMSPDTIRVAMTNAEHVKEIIDFLNEFDVYKIIMKPCASFEDFMEPVNAALEYNRLKKQAKLDLEQANLNIFFSEEDFNRLEEGQHENIKLYEQAADVVMTMLRQHFTVEEMGSKGQYVVEHYIRDLLYYYLEMMIHGNGNYLVGYSQLKNEFHHEAAGQSFQMEKKKDCEIPPEIFRKILFLLMTLTKACAQMLEKYAVSVTLETASEKFFVVRFCCDYSGSLDENGKIMYSEQYSAFRKDMADLTEKIVDSIVYRTVSMEKEHKYILNCAIERKQE